MVANYRDDVLGGRKFANCLLFWRHQKEITSNLIAISRPNAIHLGLLALQIRRAMHGDGFAN